VYVSSAVGPMSYDKHARQQPMSDALSTKTGPVTSNCQIKTSKIKHNSSQQNRADNGIYAAVSSTSEQGGLG